jgi:hypothetical protein
MRWCQRLAISISLVAFLGCERTPNDGGAERISASATTTTDADGNVVTRDPTADEWSRLSDVTKKAEVVNQRFPPGTTPTNVPPIKGSQMLPTGDLVLADGRTVILDGVSCTEQGYEYLSRFYLEPSASLLVVETGPVISGKVPAEVWVVESLGSGTSTTFPIEAGISTGWCDAKHSATSPHNDRFAALETAFAVEREAYKRAAP